MGKQFMVILPGVSVVVGFYSRFYFREKRGKSHYLTLLATTQTPRCRHLSQYFHVGLMDFNPLMPSGVVHPYQLHLSIISFRGVLCRFSFLMYFELKFVYANNVDIDGIQSYLKR